MTSTFTGVDSAGDQADRVPLADHADHRVAHSIFQRRDEQDAFVAFGAELPFDL